MGTGKIIMGDMQNIRDAKMDQVRKLVEASYVPENSSCLVLCALSTPHIIGKSGTIEINGRIDVDDVELY